jgi:hypothetical protein
MADGSHTRRSMNMASISEAILSQLGPDAMQQIGRQLGVDERTVQQGVQLGLPVLLDALARNAQTADGAQSLAGALTRDHDGSALQNLPSVIGGAQQGDGAAILEHVLGPQQGRVERGLTQQTSVDGGALLQILAPIVLAQLGSQQRQQGLDAGGISQTLRQEQQELQGGGLLDIVNQVLGGGAGPLGGQGGEGLAAAVGGGPLTQLLFSMFGPSLIKQIADIFGIDQKTAQHILTIAIPLLLAALARNAQSQKGADQLHTALERDHDGSVLGNIDEVLTDPSSRKGDKIIKKVLGPQAPAIAQTLTEQTGVDGARLLQTLAPIVLGVLGQQTRQQGLDSVGLASALQQEQDTLQQEQGDIMNVVGQLLSEGQSERESGGLLGALGRLFGGR